MNFRWKKLLALAMTGMFPAVALFSCMILLNDLIMAIIVFAGVLVFCLLLFGFVFLRHPFLSMIESTSNLLLDFNSTGVIQPYELKIATPLMHTKIKGKSITTLFDRSLTNYLQEPKPGLMWEEKQSIQQSDGAIVKQDFIVIKLPKNQKQKAMFSFEGKPVFIYNTILGTFLTKDMLWTNEDKLFAHHLLLHLLRKTEELSSLLRDFVRYIVEQLRPKTSIWGSKWLIIIVVGIAIIVIAVLLMPQIMPLLGKAMPAAAPTAQPITAR